MQHTFQMRLHLKKMIDMLEDIDDVQAVYSNVNFSDAVMAQLEE